MNIDLIKEISTSDIPDETKAVKILYAVTKSKAAIPFLLKIIEKEREEHETAIMEKDFLLRRTLQLLRLKATSNEHGALIKSEFNHLVCEIEKHLNHTK
jgi:hypothetical protein